MGDFLWYSIDGIYSVYIADVTVSDVSFLRAGLANGVFGRNIKETTSDIAKENNAIFAINGDFYGFRDSGLKCTLCQGHYDFSFSDFYFIFVCCVEASK